MKDYKINIVPNVFHGRPVFTFIKEGREGEQMIIGDINDYFKEIDRQKTDDIILKTSAFEKTNALVLQF